MTLRPPRFATLLVGPGWLLLSGPALSAPCGRPDVELTFPADQAQGAPPNAQLSARYAAPAVYDGEAVSLSDAGGREVPVSVSYDEAESLLRASPERPLAEGFHSVDWPALRGVSSGGRGLGKTVGFFVTSEDDAQPPRFDGLSSIDWDLSRDRDPCLDRLDDRFVFQLGVGAASDDVNSRLLALLVFQSVDPAAPAQAGPSLVARRAMPAEGTLEIRRPADRAGRTCFAAIVQDLLGNVSGGGDVEVCVETRRPPFFDGCAIPARPLGERSGGGGWAWLGLAIGVGLLRRGSIVGPAR